MIPYQPKHFNVDDQAHAVAVMRAHPFATLVSVRDGEPQCSHVPMVAREVDGGIVLLGHVAKANPHWQAVGGRGASLHAALGVERRRYRFAACGLVPFGSCRFYAAEPAFRLTAFTARPARFTCSSPT